MMRIDKNINEQKEVLFNSFSKENFNLDSLTNKIAVLSGKKESEVFNFFKNVRTICSTNQARKFDEIIRKALRGGEGRPPNDGNMPPPPPEERRHPPR